MAKKPTVRKNSRAARRSSDNLSIGEVSNPQKELDGKSRVLQQLAEREMRKGKAKQNEAPNSLEQELTAISEGNHPDLNNDSGNVSTVKASKNAKKNKRTKKKQERAEILKDILNEKIDIAKKRHKAIRSYRNADDEEES